MTTKTTGAGSMTGQQPDEEWFLVLEGPWERQDDVDEADEDPDVPGIPGAFLARVRENVPTWRSLGVAATDTVGCWENGRLRLGIELGDTVQIAILRVEFSEQDWAAAWAHATDGITAPTMAGARPLEDPIGAPITSPDGAPEISAAIEWLRDQLQRRIVRRVWRDNGDVVAELWSLTDPERPLVRSGPPQLSADPATATETSQLRP
jgi:hypothetical protein